MLAHSMKIENFSTQGWAKRFSSVKVMPIIQAGKVTPKVTGEVTESAAPAILEQDTASKNLAHHVDQKPDAGQPKLKLPQQKPS